MKIIAVILAILGFLLALTGVSLLRDYAEYTSSIQAEVIEVDGREPLFVISATDLKGRPLRLLYGQVSGTGIDRVPDEQRLYSVGEKVDLVHPPGKPHAARLKDSFAYGAVIWTIVIGLLFAAAGVALFVFLWKRPARAPKAKPKPAAQRPPAKRMPI